MAEYIKREDVLHRFTFEHGDYIPEVDVDNFPNMVSVKDIRRVIMELPAANVVEVKHGRWIKKHRHCGGFRRYTGIDDMGETHTITIDERVEYDDRYCSECGKQSADNFLNYCANCGAKMEG